MGYNKISLYGNQICDYLYIQKGNINYEDFQYVDSEPQIWNNSTLFLAKFNNDLTAGDSAIKNSITGYEIRRKKGVESYSEYVCTIQNVEEDEQKFIIDYLTENNTIYTYYLYPSNSNTLLSSFSTEEIKTDWNYWSLFIVDESEEENLFYMNKLFKFELNLSTDDMSNNASVTLTPNFTKHPTAQYGSTNYWSSSLTALCGFISSADGDYVQTKNMINELKDLTSDSRRKFLKDIDGNIWEVAITAVSISTEDTTIQSVKSVKISWAEIGTTENISIINNPKVPTTNWILTETGEAIPYVKYIWDEHYKWNNSYRWTANDDRFKIVNTNKGRTINDKERGE